MSEDHKASCYKRDMTSKRESFSSLKEQRTIASRYGPVQPRTKPNGVCYDVFLSFRGEDTRPTFTSHLCSSLKEAGIVVFKDDEDLPRGNSISIALDLGIERSTISIIVFSKDYAGSRWCLNELSKIMELHKTRGRVVLPVFYHVDPSEVRNQISSFGEAFQDLIQRSLPTKDQPTKDQLLRWRTDLREAGSIAGIVVLNSKNESEDIKTIVEHISEILDKKDLFVSSYPVGVDSRMQDLIEMFESHPPNDVLLLGIWGMGGIGKTLIAKSIYNEVGRNFESRSFLSNIREVWEQDRGPVNLQQQLLSDICKGTKMRIQCVESGKNVLKERLGQIPALVVLDDVDKVEQLNAFVGNEKWFGPGSRIIITTRDEHLLRFLNVDAHHVYRVKNMDERESIELFSWHAFRQPSPKEGFVELSRNIVAYSGGLPLALEVLGCSLFGREVKEWKSALDKLKKIPNNHIQKKLKISFDGLNDDTEREIFLDISCFFIGMDKDDVTHILNASGFYADSGIAVLAERSLVTVGEKNKLGMHDLLRDMGREVIREKSPKEFGKRSRLWFDEDVVNVLCKHMGTESVEGLALNLSQDDKVSFSTKAFKKMKTLRLLSLANVKLEGDYKFISRDLKWLCWNRFPLTYIPSNFFQSNLVAIELKYSSLKLWTEPLLLENLKILNLSHSADLECTPDFSKMPNLEKLILRDCPSLSKVHYTIGHLDKLHLLNLKDCTGLRSLPRSIYKLKSLRTLILSGCLMIEKLEKGIELVDPLSTLIAYQCKSICGYQGLAHHVFPFLKILNLSHSPFLKQTPDFSNLPNLEKLILKNCPNLSMIHPTIGHANRLLLINLQKCTGLGTLPRSIYNLKSLKTLCLSGCVRVEKLEEDIGKMDSLTRLIADNTAISKVPFSLVRMKNIDYISLCGYMGLPRYVFPPIIWSWMSPRNSPLSHFSQYPSTLEDLDLSGCEGLIEDENIDYTSISIYLFVCMGLPPDVFPPIIWSWSWMSPRNSPLYHFSQYQFNATISNSSFLDTWWRAKATTPNTDHHRQPDISCPDKSLGHLLIHIGNDDQVTRALSDCILQGLAQRDHGGDCVLLGDKYPYWQCFKGEGASVKFKVPLNGGCELKGMTLCCEYYPSDAFHDTFFDSSISMLVINHTKASISHYRQNTKTTFEEAEQKEIISNLNSDDQVEIIAVFDNGLPVKRIAVYLKYYESFDEQMKDAPSSSREMYGDDKSNDLKASEPKRQKTEQVVELQSAVKSMTVQAMFKFKCLRFLILVSIISFIYFICNYYRIKV